MVINNDLTELQKNIGYTFKDISFLELALTHSSVVHERMVNKGESNERIEFLGDAVLELVSSEYLYKRFPDYPEGQMTKLRASLVCEPSLANDAKEIKLSDFIILGFGENKSGGRYRDSIVSDAFEAVIGAIFLDGGFEEAKKFILRFVLNDIENKALFHDSKSLLQEFVQNKMKKSVQYKILSETGPDHDKFFVSQVFLDEEPMETGEGRSKKAAEQQAAYKTYLKLKLK
ncbi:MAG: ribonuclease III [Lachnospiraceae bacterium]|nr:ribonuclease III [Lachnospiraceae bacterium]